MFTERVDRVLAPAIIGFVALMIIGMGLANGVVTKEAMVAVVCGLGGGFLSLVVRSVSGGFARAGIVLWNALGLVIGPFGAVGLLFLDGKIAGGYFLGAGLMYCFCRGAIELVCARGDV